MQIGSSDDISSVLNRSTRPSPCSIPISAKSAPRSRKPSASRTPTRSRRLPACRTTPSMARRLRTAATLADQVLKNSVELRQMDALIEMSKWNRKASYFNWLDPSGDWTGGIGFGLGDYLAIGRSQQQEVQIKREQVRSILMEKTTVTLDDAKQTLQAYGLASDGADIQARRISRLTQDLHAGIAFASQRSRGCPREAIQQRGAAVAVARFAYLRNPIPDSAPHLHRCLLDLTNAATRMMTAGCRADYISVM